MYIKEKTVCKMEDIAAKSGYAQRGRIVWVRRSGWEEGASTESLWPLSRGSARLDALAGRGKSEHGNEERHVCLQLCGAGLHEREQFSND